MNINNFYYQSGGQTVTFVFDKLPARNQDKIMRNYFKSHHRITSEQVKTSLFLFLT